MISRTLEKCACSRCGEVLPRNLCHRKRDGSFICRPCQAARRNASVTERLLRRIEVKLYKGGRAAISAGAIFLTALVVAYLIVQIIQ